MINIFSLKNCGKYCFALGTNAARCGTAPARRRSRGRIRRSGRAKKTNLVHFPTIFQVFIYTCSIRANASGSVRCFAKPNASPSPILDGALRDHPVPRAASARFKRLHSLRFPKYVFKKKKSTNVWELCVHLQCVYCRAIPDPPVCCTALSQSKSYLN